MLGGKHYPGALSALPLSNAWDYRREVTPHPDEEIDGAKRDGDFGMKLIYWMKKAGFTIKDACLAQPLLATQHSKANSGCLQDSMLIKKPRWQKVKVKQIGKYRPRN